MKISLKKSLILLSSLILFSFSACAKSNPEIEKLNRVLLSMSPRCKAAIPNGDPQEFLADLKRVLATRSDFSSTDLSPFFLIDKTHKVGADYAPKDLIHVGNNDLYVIQLFKKSKRF